MAKGPASAEMRGDTQVEFSRSQKRPEQKLKTPDNLGVSGALSALGQDNPQVKDRKDLANLAKAGQKRKYRRFGTIDDYRESKFRATKRRGNGPENTEVRGTPAEGMDLDPRYLNIRQELKQKWLKEHPGEDFLTEAGQNYNLGYLDRNQRNKPTLRSESEGIFRERHPDDATAYDIKEKTRVYEDPQTDPAVKLADDNIIVATNNEAKDRSFGFDINWQRVHRSQSMRGWRAFAERYPEKAAAYAEKHPGIKGALEEIKRQEQAGQAQQQTQTREQVQTENDQLLADSVRVSENNQAQTAEQPSENNIPEVTATEVNAETEKGLLSAETAGVQAMLLLGGEIPAEIDRAKIEAIAKGDKPNTEKANKASVGERVEYWNGENSPYKNMTFDQKLERWRGTMKSFLDKYKGKPEAEFFERMGIDLENDNASMEIYNAYFVDGKGDVSLFASRIAENNTAEQIQKNKVIIQYLGKMYGDKSAKVAEQLIIGIKNAQTDIDSFIQAAQAGIDKGDDMLGMDLVNLLNAKKENPNDTDSMQTSSAEEDVTNSSDLTGAENTSEAIATDHNDQEFKLNWDKRASSMDTWSGGGDLKIEGDVLAFTPQVNKLRNPYSLGTTEYDYFEKYQVRYFQPDNPSDYFIGEQRKRVERGVELAVDSKAGKVPSSMFWKIIESDPESVGSGPLGRYVTLDTQSDSVKSVRPVDLKIHNDEGTPRTVDVNFSWRGLKVDRQTLVGMQQKALEYLNQQVDAGIMPAETLDTARSLVSRSKAPRTVSRPREIPLVSKFQTPEKWRSDGSLVVSDKDIVYSDAKLREIRGSRSIEIFTADPNNPSKRILTAQAWDVLDAASKGVDSIKPVTDSLTEPVMRRGGEWYRPVMTFTADRSMISKMKGLIRDNVAREIQEGAMDESVLSDIDNVLNYKNPAAEPNNITTEAVQDTASKAA